MCLQKTKGVGEDIKGVDALEFVTLAHW